jgi:SAM-dependent methyltransferase
MNAPVTNFEPRRFRTTVPYYARYRLGYPPTLIQKVAAMAGLRPRDPVLDLGCGPGLLSLPFARAGFAVTAVDPEPSMLVELRAAATESGLAIAIGQGSSFEMPAGIGPFKLITLGRSFHWMDGAATLDMLDKMVMEKGALAFFDDDHPHTVENAWRRILRDIGNKYGRDLLPHLVAARKEDFRTHHSLLLDSKFCRLEGASVIVRRRITTDDIVGLAFSLSSTCKERLGSAATEFERELRAGLAELSPDGAFTEIAELSALVASRES